MMKRCFGRKWIAGILAILLIAGVMRRQSQADEPGEVRYLAFQIFTGGPDPAMAIGARECSRSVLCPLDPGWTPLCRTSSGRIGAAGGGQTQLAVIFGPLAFDHSDAEIRRLVETAFAIALERKIAVGFHIDDSMFWARRATCGAIPIMSNGWTGRGLPPRGDALTGGGSPRSCHPRCVSIARRSNARCDAAPPRSSARRSSRASTGSSGREKSGCSRA